MRPHTGVQFRARLTGIPGVGVPFTYFVEHGPLARVTVHQVPGRHFERAVDLVHRNQGLKSNTGTGTGTVPGQRVMVRMRVSGRVRVMTRVSGCVCECESVRVCV